MLEQLMKIYAASQGLNDSLADEAASSSEDNGIHSLEFGGSLCTISEVSGTNGEPVALAVCPCATLSPDDASDEFSSALRRITELGLFAIPIYSGGKHILGMMTRLELPEISDKIFLNWMEKLESMCRTAVTNDAMIPSREPMGNETLRSLFEKAGAPLDGNKENCFWRLALPQGVIFLECDPYTGLARMRSLALERKPSSDELCAISEFNLGLSGQAWLMPQNDLVWYCSPLPVFSMKESYLNTAISLHLENLQDVHICMSEIQKKVACTSEDLQEPLYHLMHSIRV